MTQRKRPGDLFLQGIYRQSLWLDGMIERPSGAAIRIALTGFLR
jgi:hypothetical protein